MKMVFMPGYGWVFTTLSKEDIGKKIKTVMPFVPNKGWVLTSMIDLNPNTSDSEIKYYFIPGRGITVNNPNNIFPTFIPINQLKVVSNIPPFF